MRRITKIAALAAIPTIAVIGLASAAGATVAVKNGVGHVDKGDVQAALHWNNADFDRALAPTAVGITFTASTISTFDNVLTCGANADNKVVHVIVSSDPVTSALA